MEFTKEILEVINSADSRALATVGDDGPNVVPLSMVITDKDSIVICDCFMGKTAANLANDPRAAIAFWKGFVGVQVKGKISYETSGENFDLYVKWLEDKHPDRKLRGVLVLTPEAVYDLAPQNAGNRLA